MSAKQPQPDPPKKRAPAKPSDETLALRALRNIRQLDERYNREAAAWAERHKELQAERDKLVAGLSPSVAKLVEAMQRATVPEKGEAAE